MAVDLAPHQREALKKMSNGCILNGGTGVGKTRTALAYYLDTDLPERIFVITTAKKRDDLDWETEAAKHGIGKAEDATLAGVLTVDSWNNIAKYADVKNAFFIFDEQRLVGSGVWVKSFLKIAKNNQWILLSATPGDTWLDYIPVFVANGFYKNRTEFKREHVVYNTFSKFPKVERYIGVSRLVKHRDAILVDMPYDRMTTRHIEDIVVEYDEELFNKVLKKKWHVYEGRPLRDVTELFMTMRKVVNSSPDRIKKIRELMKKHPKLIVFYNFNFELEALRKLGEEIQTCTDDSDLWEGTSWSRNNPNKPTSVEAQKKKYEYEETMRKHGSKISSQKTKTSSTFSLAEWNGHKHQAVPKTDRWLYLVQYTAGSEGWNCTATDAMCFFSLTYSYRQFHQAQGRIDRMDTSFVDLWYYVLRSKSPIDHAIWRSLLAKKSFNETKTGIYALDSR